MMNSSKTNIDLKDDHLELADPVMHRQIKASMKAHRSGRTRPVRDFLAELKQEKFRNKK
mgnify:CR=1 FL=1|jgi:hypothetical protein